MGNNGFTTSSWHLTLPSALADVAVSRVASPSRLYKLTACLNFWPIVGRRLLAHCQWTVAYHQDRNSKVNFICAQGSIYTPPLNVHANDGRSKIPELQPNYQLAFRLTSQTSIQQLHEADPNGQPLFPTALAQGGSRTRWMSLMRVSVWNDNDNQSQPSIHTEPTCLVVLKML